MDVVFFVSSDYVTSIRPIAAGSVTVKVSSLSQSKAVARLRHVRETRLPTQMGAVPTRPRKQMAEDAELAVFGAHLPEQRDDDVDDSREATVSLEKTIRPGQL